MNMNNVNNNFIGSGADKDTMQLMYECFRSYLKQSHSKIGYGSAALEGDYVRNAMYYGNTVAYVDLKMEDEETGENTIDVRRMPINCSTFVNLMLLGVPYEHSRYYKEDPDRDGLDVLSHGRIQNAGADRFARRCVQPFAIFR